MLSTFNHTKTPGKTPKTTSCNRTDFGSIIILSACGMNETIFHKVHSMQGNLERFT